MGESAIYMGKDANGHKIYSGLGMTYTEEDMQQELAENYNRDLGNVIVALYGNDPATGKPYGNQILGLPVDAIDYDKVTLFLYARPFTPQ